MASIWQIGIARYVNGILAEEWGSYVDPEDYFDETNVSIHGIDEPRVMGAPTFQALAEMIYAFLDGRIVVCHTHFDRVSIHQAATRYGIRVPLCTWLDSAMVTRRAWKEFAGSGYGLYNVCKTLGYDFQHHDALEDAKAAAYILLASVKVSGLDIEGWLERVKQPIQPSAAHSGQKIRRDGNPEGPLFGEVLVFTGALELSRQEAADLAAQVGCRVVPDVTKKTTILVVGDQDIRKLAGHEKSRKHRQAEELIGGGSTIRILKESDFKILVEMSNEFA
jgi:DNA polymerase-3 subunit epsilon